jgi:hypothetical protein
MYPLDSGDRPHMTMVRELNELASEPRLVDRLLRVLQARLGHAILMSVGESTECSGSSRLAPPSASLASMPPFTTPSTFTPSRLALDATDLPSRGGGSMEKCGCRSVITYSASCSFRRHRS